MILRKPYAFLIKHFRLIHLIITIIFGYVAVKTKNIYDFLKKVIENIANRYDAPYYINYKIFIYILLALVLCFLVQWLLKYKNKPRGLYKFTMIVYAVISVFLFVLFSYMQGFTSAIVDQKTIRLYRDIIIITMLFQGYTTISMLIRGLGFDIKKFDFNRDVQELNAEAGDNEEVEVNVDVDTTNFMRLIRRMLRELGYFFKEFKGYIIVIMVVVLGIVGYKGYNYFSEKLAVYNEGDYFGGNNFVKINNSYYSDYNKKQYVIVDFDIYRYGKKEQFNIGNMILVINDNKYYADKNNCYKFDSIGNCYKKQYVTKEPNSYILSYEISEKDIKKAYLLYVDSYDKTFKVRLNLKTY